LFLPILRLAFQQINTSSNRWSFCLTGWGNLMHDEIVLFSGCQYILFTSAKRFSYGVSGIKQAKRGNAISLTFRRCDMQPNKVEICGVDTSTLPTLKKEQMDELRSESKRVTSPPAKVCFSGI
jgi:hypothetical protein